MHQFKYSLFLLFVLLFLLGCNQRDDGKLASNKLITENKKIPAVSQKTVEVSGQIFVVTSGRDNIKLALVTVSAIPESIMIDYAKPIFEIEQERRKILMKEIDILDDKLRKISSDANSGRIYLDEEQRNSFRRQNTILLKKVRELININRGEGYFRNLPKALASSKTDADGKFSISLPSGKYILAATASREVGKRVPEEYYWLVFVDTNSVEKVLFLSNDNLYETFCTTCMYLGR